jgi:pimeloyl-ACP methyl ester carboxylesterase
MDTFFKWFLILLIIIILLLIFVYNVVNCNEDKLLFDPCHRNVWKPNIKYKSVYLNVDNWTDVCSSHERKEGKEYIHGWHFNNYPGAKTIMFCHGNNKNLTYRQYIIDICHKFKLNLFLFDYRGYGRSCGFPHKYFLRQDGEIAYEYLHYHCKIPNNKILIWGESLGGITAVWTAHKYKCAGLILFSCFSSLDDALTYRFEGHSKTACKWLTSLLACKMDMIPVKQYLREVECPVVIVHSTEDEILPYACSWINYHSVSHKERLHIKIKGKHAGPDINSKQFKQIFDFFDLSLSNVSCNISEVLDDLKYVGENIKKL